jgi:transaldolase
LIPATWEGIKASEILKKQGIKVCLQYVYSVVQAQAGTSAESFIIDL